ncbi:MAG: hypothetical protein AB7G05_01855 [Hyphomonadaceae bacterium]
MTAWTLCIDFGTAFSKAAAAPRQAWARFDPGAVRPLALGAVQEAGNPLLLESAVFIDETHVLFGRAALARARALEGKKRSALRSFKTLLGAADLDRALDANALASLDPHRVFQMRDLVVLYLAYLLAAVERAAAADQALARVSEIKRRYAAPAWSGVSAASLHAGLAGLLGQAEAFRRTAGAALTEPDGVAIDLVTRTLPGALERPIEQEAELIFEAAAAAAYSSIGLEQKGTHFIVVDMGAGTTDITALSRRDDELRELSDARLTLKKAGDYVDGLIANVFLNAGKHAKSVEQRTGLWRAAMAQMADLKEALFASGRASVRHEGKVVSIGLKDLERDRDYKDFVKALQEVYGHALAVLAADAARVKARELHAIAVGGGAPSPFIRELVRTQPRGVRVKALPRPATPKWAHAPEFQGNLAPVFPQLAIAIGGALAPETMLAARGKPRPLAPE